MKVIEHIERAKEPLFSYEIVPPPRGRTVQDVVEVVKKLAPFNPPWIDVTAHSAGAYYSENSDGSIERKVFKKRPGTIGICGIIQNRFKIDTVVHLLCHGFTKEETEDALIELGYLGVENVLALRGDGLNYDKKITTGRSTNKYSSELVEQIVALREGHYTSDLSEAQPLNFCIGVAGYPEKHFEAPNLSIDIQNLKKKVDAGADYITTQMFFNNDHYFHFVQECRKAGINVPIIPGLKIIKSLSQLRTIPRNFYINFPDSFVDEMMANPTHVKEIGLAHASKQVEGLLNYGVPSVHFYIMNDADNVINVVKKFR